MLLGNELFAGKVTIHPRVVLKPVISIDIEKMEEEKLGIFSSYTVTRAQAKGKDKEGRFCGARDEIIDLSPNLSNYDINFKCQSDSLKKKDNIGNIVSAMDVSLSRTTWDRTGERSRNYSTF